METTTLDTSGAVLIDTGGRSTGGPPTYAGVRWSDLSPFAQGYVEAMFMNLSTEPAEHFFDDDYGVIEAMPMRFGFSDLAPESLAMILRDCERFAELFGEWPNHGHGKHFWIGRQRNKHPHFPPLVPYLSDDGKVCLRGAP